MSRCKACTISRYEVLCVEEILDQDLDIFSVHQEAICDFADVIADLEPAPRETFLTCKAYDDVKKRREILDELNKAASKQCPDCAAQTELILRVMVKLDMKLLSLVTHRLLLDSSPSVNDNDSFTLPRRLDTMTSSYDNAAFDPTASRNNDEPSTSTSNNAQKKGESDPKLVTGQKRKADTNLHISLSNLTLDASDPLQEGASLEETRGAADNQETPQNADLPQASGTTFNVDPSLRFMVTPKKRASRERMAALVTNSLQSIFNRAEFDPSKHTDTVTFTSSVSQDNLATSENVSGETSVSISLSDLEMSLSNLVPLNTEESSDIALAGGNRSSNETMTVPSIESEDPKVPPEDDVPEGLAATIMDRLQQNTGPSPSRPNLARIISRMKSTDPDIQEEAMNTMFFLLQSHLPECEHKKANEQARAAGANGGSESPTQQDEEEEATGEQTTPSNQKDANIPTPVRRWKKKPLRGKRKKKR